MTTTTVRALCEEVYSAMELLPADEAFAKKFPTVCEKMRDIGGRPALPKMALDLEAVFDDSSKQPPEQFVVARLLAIHKALTDNRRHESEAGIFLTHSETIKSAIARDLAGLG